uniref:Uncharacterized protein n=1 Tax=Anguilla anguilla TaxID=7936 RepID=A0A0E9PB81_ANGAN
MRFFRLTFKCFVDCFLNPPSSPIVCLRRIVNIS